jgi:hypothetical protein
MGIMTQFFAFYEIPSHLVAASKPFRSQSAHFGTAGPFIPPIAATKLPTLSIVGD